MTARALANIAPAQLLPPGFSSPMLSAFANAALYSADSSDFKRLLDEATHAAVQ